MRSVHELDGGVVVAEVLDHELSVHCVDSSINLRVVRVGLPARALVWIVTTERCDTFWNTYFTATGVRPRRSRRRRRAERNAELSGEAVSLDE